MNPISSIVLGITLLGVLLVINSTFNHNYDNSRPYAQENSEQAPLSISDIKDLKGSFISLHGNGSIYPAWIVSGKWKLGELPSNSTNSTTENLTFNGSITMTSLDGTTSHKHKLTDFKYSNVKFQNRSAIINGTISFTSSGSNIGISEKNLQQIPISIEIMNLRTISINMDNKVIKQHFGDSPIYGKID